VETDTVDVAAFWITHIQQAPCLSLHGFIQDVDVDRFGPAELKGQLGEYGRDPLELAGP
jgi:hypothetical protein